ncbi:MAG: DUF2589 domain-containing protein [Flavipsychrobacter sp.]
MANDNQLINPAADFQALPLEFVIAQPLTAAVKAQMLAAQATQSFIQSFIENGKPITVDFSADLKAADNQSRSVNVQAPLLAIVPIPHIRIDSLSVSFKYEVSQSVTDSTITDKGIDVTAGSGSLLQPWVNATIKGNLSSSSKQDSVMNRSGMMDIEMHASESVMPEGLAKLLNLLSDAIQVTPQATAQTSTQAVHS